MAELHAPGWVAGSVREGLSARQGLRQFREAGGRIRDAVWYKLYSEQQVYTSGMRDEVTRPLNALPESTHIVDMTTKRATGYLQQIDVFTRAKGTDIVTVRPFMITTQNLLSRGDAVSQALTQMQQAIDEERYEETLLGAVYTGTRRMQRGDVE